MNDDFISDDDMAKLEAHASAPDFISDDDMAKVAPASAGPSPATQPQADNSHDFVPFLKNAWHGLRDKAENFLLFGGGPGADPGDSLAGAAAGKVVDAAKDAPAAVDAYKDAREAGFSPGSAVVEAAHAGTGAAADIANGVGGLMAPEIIPFEAYFNSRQAGNSVADAAKDARNVGALIFGPTAAIKAGGAAAGAAGKLALKEAGITPEAVARYRAAPEAVQAAEKYAKDPEALKNLVDAKVAPVNQAVDQAQADVAATQDAASAAKDAVAATRQPPVSLAGEIPAHLDEMSGQLSKLSSESFDILDQQGHTFDTGDMADAVDKQMKGLRVGGVEPTVGPDAAAYRALGQLKTMVQDMGENARLTTGDTQVPASAVKRLIQSIDKTSQAAYRVNAGELGPEAATNLAEVRGAFNRALRDASPEYAAKMDELAPKVSLVSDMSKMFGSEPAALNALKAAGDPATPRGYVVRQMLEKYDAANGTDFGKRVADYYDKPRAALSEAQANLETGRNALAGEQAAAEKVNLLGPGSTENTLKAIQGGRNIEARRQLEALDPAAAQTVQDAGIAKQFMKSTTNGSRKAQIGKAMGGAVGAVAGGAIGGAEGAVVGASIGHGVGGALGGLADQYGGYAVKRALDAGIKLNKVAGTKYAPVLMRAAQEGQQRAAVVHYMLNSTDPGYQALMRAADDQDDSTPASRQPAE